MACAVVLAFSAGCGAGDEGRDAETADPAGGDGRAAEAAGETGVAADPEDGDGGFVASGTTSGGEAGAAGRIEDVRFRVLDGYERLLVEFGGGDAGVPRWSVERPEEGGYVRLRLPGVAATAVAHEEFVGSVLDELYVVRDRDGGLFVDVFAMHGFRYRVTEPSESGRLVVDFRGVAEEVRLPPTTGDEVAVLQPREAEEVESPIDVRGYARPSRDRITVSLLDRERDVVASKVVRTDDSGEAWGLFETTLGFSGYEGLATLRVGGRGAGGGPFAGTETEVFLESSGPG